MSLTARQLETIKHLKKYRSISTPDQIIAWAKGQLLLPAHNPNLKKRPHRWHSLKYYQDILNHFNTSSKPADNITEDVPV